MKTRQLLLIFTLLLPIGTWADEYTDPATNVIYTYTVGSGVASVKAGASTTAGSPDATGDITILSSFTVGGNNYSVTSIGDRAFYGRSSLNSVTISNSVTSIGNYAFMNCGITSITIDNNVVSIGNYAFENCRSLTSANIPNSVMSIGSCAFEYCNGLTSVNIPASVTSIGGSAFANCSGLTSIVVEDGNTKYDSRGDCNAIIETASNTLIKGCKNTIIPNSVTAIGYNAFRYCNDLTSIEIPNSVTSIGEHAFHFSGLTSVTIPNGMTSLEQYVFGYCSGLKTITIPNNIINIKNSAFEGCTSLTTVSIPNSVTNIGISAFSGCNNLTSITIPSGVTSIENVSFSGCSSLTSITIPSNVTSIGQGAFQGCSGLTSITIMGNPTIGSNAFPSNKTITQTLTANSVGSDKWLTYYNDYANFQADANTKVYKGSVEDGNVALTAVNDKIVKAGKAVLLKSTSETITMTSTTTASADDYADNQLRGLNTRTATWKILTADLSGGTIYVLGNQNSHFGFHEYTGEYMAANKTFLALPSSSSGSRRLNIVFRNGETGVDMPICESAGASANDWYTLDGRKLVAEPTASGVYVNQGKKIIVK